MNTGVTVRDWNRLTPKQSAQWHRRWARKLFAVGATVDEVAWIFGIPLSTAELWLSDKIAKRDERPN